MAIPFIGWAAAGQMDVKDKDISIAIESRFLIERAVPEKSITVQTDKGVVTLAGEVPTLLAKERAGKIVASIRGVQALINTIQVKPVRPLDNEKLQLNVLAALAADPATDSYELNVNVEEGSVSLSGIVDSWQEKQLSEEVVKSVKGVRDLDSRITVKPAASRPDSEIEAEVIRRLQSDVWVHENLIGIIVDHGRVTLTGTVGSLAEKYSAFTDAWVSGVTAVSVDRLKVEWWAQDRMLRNPGNIVTGDTRIEHAVHTALTYDPRLQNVEIGIRVIDGTVVLSGVVDNMAAKYAAEETALNTVGIWQVRNMINVQSPMSVTDEELEQRVRASFDQHPFVDRYELKITSKQGRIFLEGYLRSPFEISQAVRTASGVKGVTDVVNYLEIQSQGQKDEEIWKKIRRSFWWDPRLYDRDISIVVENGIATLDGTIPSLLEWRLARQLAKEAGAEQVRNNLTVTYGLGTHSAISDSRSTS